MEGLSEQSSYRAAGAAPFSESSHFRAKLYYHPDATTQAGRLRMPDDQPGLGPRLRATRRAAGLSQQQLADRAGLSVSAVSKAEQGLTDPRGPTLEALARALGVTEADLSGGK